MGERDYFGYEIIQIYENLFDYCIFLFFNFRYFRSSFFSKSCVETGATNIDTLCNCELSPASSRNLRSRFVLPFSVKKIELIMRNEKSTN